jgi:hypothetical protein
MMTPGRLASFGLSAAASLAILLGVTFEGFHAAWVGVCLSAVLGLHLLRIPRLVFPREAAIYAGLLAYMALQLVWTDDRALAMNTLLPAANLLLLIVLYATLATLHELEPVLLGALAGFAAAAAAYTLATGFPLTYPADFSYNAVAGMHVYGLLVALLLASVTAWRKWLLAIAAVAWAHVLATTSIKVNLGIAFGALVAGALHLGFVARAFWRHAVAILAIAGVLALAVASNPAAVEALRRGSERVALGLHILAAREDLPGYSAFSRRTSWLEEGMRGWSENPFFGHGVEAFRAVHGITSHSTFVDLAYNSGLAGVALFYGLLLSIALRLRAARGAVLRDTRVVVLGGLACYFFVSLSAPVHYAPTLGAFIGLSVAMLRRA